jgi:hypothetical protein
LPDGVHAAVDEQHATGSNAPVDCAPVEPQLDQLSPGNHTVLALG